MALAYSLFTNWFPTLLLVTIEITKTPKVTMYEQLVE